MGQTDEVVLNLKKENDQLKEKITERKNLSK